MEAYKLPKSQQKIVRSRDFEAIEWTQTISPAGLKDRESRLFQLLLAVLRMNRRSRVIRVSIGELCAVHARAHLGHVSPATTRRALAGLEELGYLRRRRYRVGSACQGLELLVNLKRWEYWIQPKLRAVEPTSVYISSDRSLRAGEDRTITPKYVNPPNHTVKSENNMHKGKVHKYHPILFTLWIVLTKAKAADRTSCLKRAEIELNSKSAGVEIANHSGIPWEQYSRRWRDMLPPVRESFASSQIVPQLRGARLQEDLEAGEELASRRTSRPARSSPPGGPRGRRGARLQEDLEAGDIKTLIERSLFRAREFTSTEKTSTPAETEQLDLDSAELELLRRARDRCRVDRR